VRLIVRPEAEADIAEGYVWYGSQQVGLGERFVAELSRCIAEIEREPLRFARIRNEARRVLRRRFPYAVFFVVGQECISVVAALHMARDPITWQERMASDL
jgi:plasmid stabilization system protein ParE